MLDDACILLPKKDWNLNINALILSSKISDRLYIAHTAGVRIVDIENSSVFDIQYANKLKSIKNILEITNHQNSKFPLLLLMGEDRYIKIFSNNSITQMNVSARCGCVNKEGTLLALANINDTNDINIYNTNDLSKPISTLSIADNNEAKYGIYTAYHMAFVGNKLACVTGDEGSRIRVFDLDTKERRLNYSNGQERIDALFSSDIAMMPYMALFKTWQNNWLELKEQ